MKRTNWPVEEFGIRPAGKPTECFYCNEPKGGTHKPDCVIRERTVVVEVTIQMVVSKPENWSPDEIEFHFNESSSCLSNPVEQLVDLNERMIEAGDCLCGMIDVKYLREATASDENKQKLFVKDIPS